MTSGITDATLGEPKSNQQRRNPNVTIFIICLLISIITWMMIRLSRDYTQLVKVSVNYTGLQSDKVILPASDTVFYVSLHSTGYNILYRNIIRPAYHINIDLSHYTAKMQGENFVINVALDQLRELIAANFKQKETIVAFSPETLNIRLDKAFIKKVPVMLDAEISYEKQYSLYQKIFIDPDSVLVSGKQDILKNIGFVKTVRHTFNNLSANASVTLKLVNKNTPLNIRYSSEYVKVFIPVVQTTEDVIEIPVTADSLSAGMHLTSLPEKVKVYYSVCIPDTKKVNANQFQLTIPANEFIQTGNKAKVVIRKSPSFIKILRIEPEIVEFTIHK